GVIVGGEAFFQVAQEMFVDKIKPEKAFRLSLRRIAKTGQQVPGSSYKQEHHKAGEQAQPEQMAQIARQQKEEKDGSDRNNQANQSFGQDVERHGRRDAPA